MLCLIQSFQKSKAKVGKTKKLPFASSKKTHASDTKLNDDHLLHPDSVQERTTALWRHDKKLLSGSAPSVTYAPLLADTTFTPSTCRSRQKKFLRHFKVNPEEQVIDYFSCALVADILLQGHLYISKNYFAFYSNVFGYVTKLLIPTASVVTITKEKTAFILPNAVGVSTSDNRHVFSSLLSRDTTYRLMVQVWRSAATATDSTLHLGMNPEVEPDGSVFDESSSQSGSESVLNVKSNAKTIVPTVKENKITSTDPVGVPQSTVLLGVCTLLLVVLFLSASLLMYRVVQLQNQLTEQYSRSPTEDIQEFLNSNLDNLYKVQQSLEVLSVMMKNEKDKLNINNFESKEDCKVKISSEDKIKVEQSQKMDNVKS